MLRKPPTRRGRSKDASIRAEFCDSDDDSKMGDSVEDNNPGPGAYRTTRSSMSMTILRPHSMQLFGTCEKRFINPPNDSGLSPGEYKTRNSMESDKFNSVIRAAGTAAFKAPKRKDNFNLTKAEKMPDPGIYIGE